MSIVTLIMTIVLGMALESFIDANKAKSTAIASGVLKGSGQVAVNDLYRNLHQTRHLIDRDATADTFLGRLPIAGLNATGVATCSPGAAAGELVLPEIQTNGSFMSQDATGTVNPNFTQASVGNALFFATVEPKAVLDQGATNVIQAVFGGTQFFITPYKLHLYLLARRALPVGIKYRGTSAFDYELMHWESKPYLDYKELVAFMGRIKGYSGSPTLNQAANTFIDAKLTSLATGFAGALDLQAPNASVGSGVGALMKMQATPSHTDLVDDTSSLFKTYRYANAVNFSMRESFGEPMVCYNTFPYPAAPAAATIPAFSIPSVDNPGVPAYATRSTTVPYGFETMIAGPPDARQVLVRLTLAAVTNPGSVRVGESFQQIAQVYDY